jgi:hypothetical protein
MTWRTILSRPLVRPGPGYVVSLPVTLPGRQVGASIVHYLNVECVQPKGHFNVPQLQIPNNYADEQAM